MSAPPGHPRLTSNGITGTRTKAEIRRELADRINAAGRRAGVQLLGWQVRLMMSTLIAAGEEPTEEEVFRSLMAAPWFRAPRHRAWRIGEVGWRVRS